jgi:hypothetical protein
MNPTPVTNAPTGEARSNRGLGGLLVGLVLGAGAAGILQEQRVAEAERRADVLSDRGNEVIKHAYPVVIAAALEGNLPPPPGAHLPQGVPNHFRDSKEAAKEHTEGFGKAVQDFQGTTAKK